MEKDAFWDLRLFLLGFLLYLEKWADNSKRHWMDFHWWCFFIVWKGAEKWKQHMKKQKWRRFSEIFHFSFHFLLPKKVHFCQRVFDFFQISSTEKSGFCQPLFPFSWHNTADFSKRRIKRKIFWSALHKQCRKGGSGNRKAQKKQETFSLISCSVCRCMAAVIQLWRAGLHG